MSQKGIKPKAPAPAGKPSAAVAKDTAVHEKVKSYDAKSLNPNDIIRGLDNKTNTDEELISKFKQMKFDYNGDSTVPGLISYDKTKAIHYLKEISDDEKAKKAVDYNQRLAEKKQQQEALADNKKQLAEAVAGFIGKELSSEDYDRVYLFYKNKYHKIGEETKPIIMQLSDKKYKFEIGQVVEEHKPNMVEDPAMQLVAAGKHGVTKSVTVNEFNYKLTMVSSLIPARRGIRNPVSVIDWGYLSEMASTLFKKDNDATNHIVSLMLTTLGKSKAYAKASTAPKIRTFMTEFEAMEKASKDAKGFNGLNWQRLTHLAKPIMAIIVDKSSGSYPHWEGYCHVYLTGCMPVSEETLKHITAYCASEAEKIVGKSADKNYKPIAKSLAELFLHNHCPINAIKAKAEDFAALWNKLAQFVYVSGELTK